MKRKLAFCALVAAGYLFASGTHLYVLAGDPNCVQPLYETTQLPEGIDPNVVQGFLLPPQTEPNVAWEIQVGKFNRTGRACDPEGHPFDIECLSATVPVTLSLDIEDGTWTLATESLPGVNCVVIEATDAYGAVTRFTVAWLGVGNQAPRLY